MRYFQALTDDAIIPQRATPGSAGYDFHANKGLFIPPGQTRLVKTGITAVMADTDVLLLHIRSSMAWKLGLMLSNGVGVIDADYYPNEICVLLYNATDKDICIEKGQKIAQGLFMNYQITDNDATVQKARAGGFGSTGV